MTLEARKVERGKAKPKFAHFITGLIKKLSGQDLIKSNEFLSNLPAEGFINPVFVGRYVERAGATQRSVDRDLNQTIFSKNYPYVIKEFLVLFVCS